MSQKKYLFGIVLMSSLLPSIGMTNETGSGALAALKKGDWLVRGRVLWVIPNDSTGAVSGIANTEAGVNNDTVPELDFTYMFTNNLGMELILGTTRHHVSGIKGVVAGVGVADTNLLPPTLTLQYHFDGLGRFRPYAGVGINYTKFFNTDVHSTLAGLGATKVEFEDSWGPAAQIGLDTHISKEWFANLDVKYIHLNTEMTITGGAVPGLTTDVRINPWVFGVGIGRHF